MSRPIMMAALVLGLLVSAAGRGQEPMTVVFRQAGRFVQDVKAGDGLDVELLHRFAAWHRLKKEQELTWTTQVVETVPELLDAVREGRATMGLGGITITAERDLTVDFSTSYLPVRMVLVARSGAFPAGELETALRGRRIGAVTGSTNAAESERLAASIPDLAVDTSFRTNEELFAALSAAGSSLDAAVVDVTHFWSLGKEAGLVRVVSLGDPQGLGVVLPEGSPYRTSWNEFLDELSHTTAYYRLIRKYFGRDAEEMVRLAREE